MPAILQLLQRASYTGLLCVEIDNPAAAWRRFPEEELVRQSVDYLRHAVGKLTARPEAPDAASQP